MIYQEVKTYFKEVDFDILFELNRYFVGFLEF
jgi:hypothetical protein